MGFLIFKFFGSRFGKILRVQVGFLYLDKPDPSVLRNKNTYLKRVSCPEVDRYKGQPDNASGIHCKSDKLGLVKVLWNLKVRQYRSLRIVVEVLGLCFY